MAQPIAAPPGQSFPPSCCSGISVERYGVLAPPDVARAVRFARLKGVALALAPPPRGGIKSAEYLALNPPGTMPTSDISHIS